MYCMQASNGMGNTEEMTPRSFVFVLYYSIISVTPPNTKNGRSGFFSSITIYLHDAPVRDNRQKTHVDVSR